MSYLICSYASHFLLFHYLTNLFVICSLPAMLSVMFSPFLGYSTSPLYSIYTVHAEGATPQFKYHIEYFPQTPQFPPLLSLTSTDLWHLC